MTIQSTLRVLMAWWFSTRTSVTTVLSTHPCVSIVITWTNIDLLSVGSSAINLKLESNSKHLFSKMLLKELNAYTGFSPLMINPTSCNTLIYVYCFMCCAHTAPSRVSQRRSYFSSLIQCSQIHMVHDDVIKCKYFPVTGEFPSHRPVTRCFDVFFDLCLNKRLSKQSWGWWFETPSRSLWRHCNVLSPFCTYSVNVNKCLRGLRLRIIHQATFYLCYVIIMFSLFIFDVSLVQITIKLNLRPIRITSYDDVSNHRELACLFNSFWHCTALFDILSLKTNLMFNPI